MIAIFLICWTICFPDIAFAAKPEDPIDRVMATVVMTLILGVIAVVLNIFRRSKHSPNHNFTVDQSSQRIHTESACKPHDTNFTKLPTRWLWFYTYVYLPLTVLMGLAFVLADYDKLNEAGYEIEFNLPVILTILYVVIYFIFTCFLIYGLHKRRFWGWVCNWINLGVIVLLNRSLSLDSWGPYIVTVILLSLIFFLPNYFYFTKRKSLFVRRSSLTEKPLNHKTGSAHWGAAKTGIPHISFSQEEKPGVPTISEEELYEAVAAEIETNKVKKGLWTKAFSLANGNEPLTKSTYIKLRAEQMLNEEKYSQRQAIVEAEAPRLNVEDTTINLSGFRTFGELEEEAKENPHLSHLSYLVGKIVYEGKLVPKNVKVARLWFQRAADNGYEPAKEVLRQLAYFPKNVPVSDTLRRILDPTDISDLKMREAKTIRNI